MDKQPSRLHGAAASSSPYRGASTRSVDHEPTSSPPSHDKSNNSGSGSAATTSASHRFDALEKLGPSLLDVLTYVRPPEPSSMKQSDELPSTQQEPGEDAGESNSADYDTSELTATTDAKFDVCITRAAVIGRVVDPSADNARKTQEFFAKMLEQLQCEVTGLVLLQDSTFVLFLETTSDEMLSVFRCLHDQQRVLDVASIRVLASCDDNPVRILQGLYFKKVTINNSSGGSSSDWTDDSLRTLTVDAFLNLVKFVKKLGPMAPAEIRKVLSNLSNSDQTLLPSNELLLWFIGREDILTLADFLELFAEPIMLELESERVWPVHPLLQY
ncbi:hypothetical protein P43SY_006938 [Pythium insidiosum]|uniref:Uncharacterized protein n=1 Tax=Pythium insidiosum TaxID=114742 RepID=A0AAD5M5K1_PYTIN|nr:hypothetical protein P43SY_006938 [Pythium insidiosum]